MKAKEDRLLVLLRGVVKHNLVEKLLLSFDTEKMQHYKKLYFPAAPLLQRDVIQKIIELFGTKPFQCESLKYH